MTNALETDVERAPDGGRLSSALVLSGALLLAAWFVLPACGLVGGGTEGEGGAEGEAGTPTPLEATEKELDAAYTQISILKAELGAANQQAAAKEAALAAEAESGVISLEKARLHAVRYAQANIDVYQPEYQQGNLVWEVESAEEQDEFYYIYVTYRPFGDFAGTPGREEFIMDKTGSIEFRQVLDAPNPDEKPPEPKAEDGGG